MISGVVSQLMVTMAVCLFGLGVICVAVGIIVLVSKVMGGEVKELTKTTSQLAQKGLAEDVAGLLGNASSLIDAFNQLARTAAGIGVFLVLVGFPLIALAYYVLIQVR